MFSVKRSKLGIILNLNKTLNRTSSTDKNYLKLGELIKELKPAKNPEKVPKGYFNLYNGVMNDSQHYLKCLKWLMQKDELKQDSFLIGSPPGAFRRNLALSFAEINQREVEYLCLTKDTTESDIKQRREVINSSILYVNQCAVNAALNGRILIIEGIEKAERNLLPILNNLLENREMNLDDGHFLVSPERYDKLNSLSNEQDLKKLNLLRVHEDFRVIAIGLPVPKYKGNLLDPPLRSRFQAHLVSFPAYEDFNKFLTTQYERVNKDLIKNICDFGYSFYASESLNLPDFPLENLDKVVKIMNNIRLEQNPNELYQESYLNTSNLINKLYPFKFLLKKEPENEKFYFNLMKKFNLNPPETKNSSEIDYKLKSIENSGLKSKINFESMGNRLFFEVENGNKRWKSDGIKDEFILNDYHSSQLIDMFLNHSSGSDFCLIGPTGCGKTELIKKFSNLLNYDVQTVHLYKDMSSRDLFQQRITLPNGDTKWNNSALIEGALNGDLVVLDGIHRLNDDTLMSLRRLIQDRDLDLPDGTKLLRHDKFDDLIKTNFNMNIKRISPTFRIIATAEPVSEWLNSETLNLFIYQQIEPLDLKHEHEILSKMFTLNEKHETLLKLVEKLKLEPDTHLKHVSKLFSLRKLIRLSNKIEKYENLDLRELIESACLFKFMPSLNKQALDDFLNKNGLVSGSKVESNETLLISQNSELSSNLKQASKIPDVLFFENKLHTKILNNLIRDFELGDHLLLIGNQGTGKNKLVDKFLMLTQKPREYIQLHRDTTVHSLTIQPVIKNGVIEYEDSPLVKAIKNGHVLVIDEADKAPLHVTSILKSLIESGDMILSDGRRIINSNFKSDSDKLMPIHPNFRMIILANRPGFPFLGNDFFSILGDLLSCHPIDNPDPESEIQMIKMYAPNVPETTLSKLVSAFGSLRQLSDQGLISYPYSTREIINIVKHLEKFPDDSLPSVLANVYHFDHFSQQSDLKSTFKQVMNKHGIPIDVDSYQINLSKIFKLGEIKKFKKFNLNQIEFNFSKNELNWKKIGLLEEIDKFKPDLTETRIELFTELKKTWSLTNKQKKITDFMVKDRNGIETVYITGTKPLTLLELNAKTNQCLEYDLNSLFKSAWRSYYPSLKLIDINSSDSILIHEETMNDLFKINLNSLEVLNLNNKKLNLKSIGKFFRDETESYKLIKLNNKKLALFNSESNQFLLNDLEVNTETCFNLGSLRINNFVDLGSNLALMVVYDLEQVKNIQNLRPEYFKFIILNYSNLEFYEFDKNLLGNYEDFLLGQIEVLANSDKVNNKVFIPTTDKYFISIENNIDSSISSSVVNRDSKLRDKRNFNQKNKSPILKSIIDLPNSKLYTQIPKECRPSCLENNPSCLSYLELIDLNDSTIRYLEIPKIKYSSDNNWDFNSINESNFLFDLSKTRSGILYTLDFNSNLHEYETDKLDLERSLDEWKKLVLNQKNENLKLEIFKDSPNSQLREFKGPKHGKIDDKNTPHVGGNTWAGGTGGFDTAGLGGVGGPYRLDSGHQVFQVSDQLKQSVPEEVKKAAREMAQKVFQERLKEIQMSEYEHEIYSKYLNNVKKPIQQLRNILDSLEAKTKERQWLKNQIQGDLDDGKLVEAITGEKNVYRRRGEDPNVDKGFNIEKPKRLKLVVDVSGSMYRFNGVDNRLERELESVLMVMEAFQGYENKIVYDIVGHSGDGYDINFVNSKQQPKNEAERLKVLKTMLAHSQFCSSGDHTFEATKFAIQEISKEDADDHFVIVLSDANFDRYGLSPRVFSKIMLDTDPKVNVFCIFIGTLGNQATYLKKSLPSNKAFVCLNTNDVPKIMQQIFQSVMLS